MVGIGPHAGGTDSPQMGGRSRCQTCIEPMQQHDLAFSSCKPWMEVKHPSGVFE